MKASALALAALGFSCLTLPAMAQPNNPMATQQGTTQMLSSEQQAIIEKVVKDCVEVVHQYPVHHQIGVITIKEFFASFDAFYNPATGTVQNNAPT